MKLCQVEPVASIILSIGTIKSPVIDINEKPSENSVNTGLLYSGSHIFNNVIPVIRTPVKVPN